MRLDFEGEIRQKFSQLFGSVGGGLSERAGHEEAIGVLAEHIATALGVDKNSICCGIVRNLDVNAWVLKDQSTYFIGISEGLEGCVYESIGRALGKLSSQKQIHHSTVEELQRILRHYALAFIVGHQCGHIALGHIDKELALAQMASEASSSNTILEEAHADMIGAFATISLSSLDRMISLTTVPIAVGLLQLPVLCVILEYQKAAAKVKVGGHPASIIRLPQVIQTIFTKAAVKPAKDGSFFQSVIRLMLVASTLTEIVPSLFGETRHKDIQRIARDLLTLIVQAVSPEMEVFMLANPKELGHAIRELQGTIEQLFDQWPDRGSWLTMAIMAVPAEFRSKPLSKEPNPEGGNSSNSLTLSETLAQFDLSEQAQTRFNKVFADVGGRMSTRTGYEQAIVVLASSLAQMLGIDVEAIYGGILVNGDVNAFVAKDQGAYFIGVCTGITSGVQSSIAAALGRLSSMGVIPTSTVKELQGILNFYALAFVLGHECGHIALGHIDRELALVQMAGETTLSNTYLEEAQADMFGAMAMIGVKRGIYRMSSLTSESTAVGLLQLPVLCVLSEFKKATAKVTKGSGYPHPMIRLMLTGQILTEVVPSLFELNNPSDTLGKAQAMLTPILDSVSPEMHAFLRDNPEEVGDAIRELHVPLRPLFAEWLNRGAWLAFDTPEYQNKSSPEEPS